MEFKYVSDDDFSECPMLKFTFAPLIWPIVLLAGGPRSMEIDAVEGISENPDI